VSSVSNAGGQPSRRPIALVLAVIGVLLIILGIVYLAVPAGDLPSILGHTTPANGHHVVRMTVSLVVGVACLVAAWFVNKGGKASADAGASAPAEASTRD
jgi:protein-S-isoprenylcysteine O-methyltransferase Ste14